MMATTSGNGNTERPSTKRPFTCGVVEGFYGRPWTPEQRKELFRRLAVMGMNVYVYAPKDDLKHRAHWRDPYTVEEADHLQSLIEAAKEQNISFIYAISPGLDITYCSTKELNFIKHKLDQVRSLGCDGFALLFDDIDPTQNDDDKKVFDSIAHAQVAVTNEIFEHLSQPIFMFCPTEYCESRAVPTLETSTYLNLIGQKLHPDIMVMWTGPRVVSKLISVKHIQAVARVLRRQPLIWDNLHANDYDHRRLFLGPYHGRPLGIKECISGIVTNPNCEFEANWVAMHSLAHWSRCSHDKEIKNNDKMHEEAVDARLFPDTSGNLDADAYDPHSALQGAIDAWLAEISAPRDAFSSDAYSQKPPAALPLPVMADTPSVTALSGSGSAMMVNSLAGDCHVATPPCFPQEVIDAIPGTVASSGIIPAPQGDSAPAAALPVLPASGFVNPLTNAEEDGGKQFPLEPGLDVASAAAGAFSAAAGGQKMLSAAVTNGPSDDTSGGGSLESIVLPPPPSAITWTQSGGSGGGGSATVTPFPPAMLEEIENVEIPPPAHVPFARVTSVPPGLPPYNGTMEPTLETASSGAASAADEAEYGGLSDASSKILTSDEKLGDDGHTMAAPTAMVTDDTVPATGAEEHTLQSSVMVPESVLAAAVNSLTSEYDEPMETAPPLSGLSTPPPAPQVPAATGTLQTSSEEQRISNGEAAAVDPTTLSNKLAAQGVGMNNNKFPSSTSLNAMEVSPGTGGGTAGGTEDESAGAKDGKQDAEMKEMPPCPSATSESSIGTAESPMFMSQLSREDVELLAKLFYLPFEHSPMGNWLVFEFCWLRYNGPVVANAKASGQLQNMEEWARRAAEFSRICFQVSNLTSRLSGCPNRGLVYDLYPYCWDAAGILMLLDGFVKWLGRGHYRASPYNDAVNGSKESFAEGGTTSSNCSESVTSENPRRGHYRASPYNEAVNGSKESFAGGGTTSSNCSESVTSENPPVSAINFPPIGIVDQEAWVFRGGLFGELQCQLPLETGHDLFTVRTPCPPTSQVLSVRPYNEDDDKQIILNLVQAISDKAEETSTIQYDPVADKTLLTILLDSYPEYAFVVEDNLRADAVVGFGVGALDATKVVHTSGTMAVVPQMAPPTPTNAAGDKSGINDTVMESEPAPVVTNVAMMEDTQSNNKPTDDTAAADTKTSEHSSVDGIAAMSQDEEPHWLLAHYPGFIKLQVLPNYIDTAAPKRLAILLLAALKLNGCRGVFTRVAASDRTGGVDTYSRLGFFPIVRPESKDNPEESDLFYGRVL